MYSQTEQDAEKHHKELMKQWAKEAKEKAEEAGK